MGCGMDMVKYILFIFNLICALCGIALISVGAAVLLKYDDIIKAFHENTSINVAPILFIVIGSIIFLIAFFGCCGAIRESQCLVLTYATILFVVLVVEIILGVLIFVNVDEVRRLASRQLLKLWNHRNEHKSVWDAIQQTLECCGNTAVTDWQPQTPASCCRQGTDNCFASINSFTRSCSDAVNSGITGLGTLFGSTALAIAGIQLVGFVFACCLANNIRNQERRSAY